MRLSFIILKMREKPCLLSTWRPWRLHLIRDAQVLTRRLAHRKYSIDGNCRDGYYAHHCCPSTVLTVSSSPWGLPNPFPTCCKPHLLHEVFPFYIVPNDLLTIFATQLSTLQSFPTMNASYLRFRELFILFTGWVPEPSTVSGVWQLLTITILEWVFNGYEVHTCQRAWCMPFIDTELYCFEVIL